MGGRDRLDKRRAEGKLNVRQRIEYFFDPGTFQEIGLFTHSTVSGMESQTPTDGKIIGWGRVNGRPMGAVANDLTILGASSSTTNMKKIEYMRSLTCERGLPLVFLTESTGGRMPDGLGSRGMGVIGQNKAQYRRLRETPWISVLLGPCYGSSSWYSAMSDINVMLQGAVMAVSSPKVTQIAISEDVSAEDMGGWQVHSRVTGLVDAVGATEAECMDTAKQFFSNLPLNSNEVPPRMEVPEDSGKDMPHILELLPEKSNRTYDMHKIIRTLVDGGQMLELKAEFGKPCITAFSRLDGHSIGIIANNPLHGAGALNADCCEKITSFLVLCDSFNIPIIMLVDTPGFLVGQAGEYRKMTGKIINWMNALALVTVPVITVIIRKSFGQAYLNMGGGKHSDIFVAWPNAQISFMDPEPAISVLYNLKREDDPEKFEKLLAEMTRNVEPWDAAGIFGLNDIIAPTETRQFLTRMLNLHYNRHSGGIGRHLLNCWPTSY